MAQQEKNWIDCQFIRFTQKDAGVVRIVSSGSIVPVFLRDPLDLCRACMITAVNPTPAKIHLGEYKNGAFHGCDLDIVWPVQQINYPPPQRFIRRKRTPSRQTGETNMIQ